MPKRIVLSLLKFHIFLGTHMGGDGLWNTGRMQKQNSFVLLRQLGSLSNFHLFLWQLKHLEITFSSMEEWFFFSLPLAVIVIRILISKVECREENDWKKKAHKRFSIGRETKGQLKLPHSLNASPVISPHSWMLWLSTRLSTHIPAWGGQGTTQSYS